MSTEITMNDAGFDETLTNSDLPILVDFWAPWCGPCRVVGPILTEIADEKSGVLRIGKLNVDDNPQVSQKYGISSIPTMMLFKDGKPVERLVGAMPKEMLLQALSKHL